MRRGETDRRGIIDFVAKKTAKESHAKRESEVRQKREKSIDQRQSRAQQEASPSDEQQADIQHRSVLQDQLRSLLERIEISEETLRDPRSVEDLSRSYKKMLDEQKRAITRHDTSIIPLQAAVKRDETRLSLLQKQQADIKGLAKFLQRIFPAFDLTSKEIAILQARLETSRHTLGKKQKGRSNAESAGTQYNEFVDTLQRAVSTLQELDTLSRATPAETEVSRKKVVALGESARS